MEVGGLPMRYSRHNKLLHVLHNRLPILGPLRSFFGQEVIQISRLDGWEDVSAVERVKFQETNFEQGFNKIHLSRMFSK